MTFGQPAWLLLLVALPVVWWLHRRLRRPREVVVASVAPFRADGEIAAAAAPTRPLDPELWLVMGSMTVLALAAAAPAVGGDERSELHVVVDDSWSMNATDPGARHAWTRLLAAVEILALDTRFFASPLSAPAVEARWWASSLTSSRSVTVRGTQPVRSDGLPASLAAHLAQRGPPLVLLTDRDLDLGPDVLVVRSEGIAAPVFGIVGVVLDGDDLAVTLRHAGRAPDGPVRLSLRARDRETVERAVTFGDDDTVSLRFPAPFPAPGEAPVGVHLSVRPGSGVSLGLRRPTRRVLLDGPQTAGALGTVLDAVGAEIVTEEPDAIVLYRNGGRETGGAPYVIVAGAFEQPARQVDIASLSGTGAFAEFRPADDAVLFARGAPPEGRPVLLRDRHGPLVGRYGRDVIVALDPTAPGSTWDTDPSFPVFFAMALETIAGGTGIEAATGIVPLDELRAPPLEEGALDEARLASFLARSRRAASGTPLAGPLALVGAVLLLGLLLPDVLRGRFSMPRRGSGAAR